MKKIALCFFTLIAITATGFAENLLLDNKTSYPSKDQKSKIAVQWASSGKEVDESNQAVIFGSKQNPDTIQMITQKGKIKLNIPEKAEYFRVLAWSTGEEEPDLLTNWVEIKPNKTYKLQTDHLVPSVLMLGTGC
jgi:hypothetical protein